jgi:hypothetical protein
MSMKKCILFLLLANAIWLFSGCSSTPQATVSSVEESVFLTPDSSRYIGVWWWWLRCKTTKEAITLDLEEMKAKKIQRLILADFGSGGKLDLEYLDLASPEWNEMVKHAIRECKRLGLDFGITIGPAGCGAPFVTPEESQQKLIFSETKIEGPGTDSIQLPYPKTKMDKNGLPVCYRDISVVAVPDREIIAKDEIIDLSASVNESGLLNWNAPAGTWKIIRYGFAPTYSTMREFVYLDHLQTGLYDRFFAKYFGDLLNSLTEEERSAVKILENDSWEAGSPNWSKHFAADFKRLRGYDPSPYLPVLSGQTVENKEVSERFKADYRLTISDLIVEHYKYQQETAHRHGTLTLNEASGPHQHHADALLCQKYSDLPMGEFWVRAKTHRITLENRFMAQEAVSAAHIYGKTVIPAESFTSIGPHWEEDPQFLKPTADRAFCEGINQIYLHAYSHSPSLTAKPGYVYYAGTHLDRNITWWDYSYDWFDFLSRCQYMLQQGLPAVDVCFYYGDGYPDRMKYKQEEAATGQGYKYDYTNADAILTRMETRDGKIRLPDGMQYEILVLPNRKEIPLEVLEKIKKLVHSGATVAGVKPETSTGLYRYEKTDRKVKKIADELWGQGNAPVVDKTYGKGRIVCGKSISEILADRNILPDMTYKSYRDGSSIDFTHRKVGDTEIYYLANLVEKADYLNVTFRVAGKTPSIWNPADGSVAHQPVYADDGERISMPLYLDPFGSVFIVFRQEKDEKPHIVSVSKSGENIFPQLPAQLPETPYYTFPSDGKWAFHSGGDYELTYSNGEKRQIEVRPLPSTEITSPWKVSFSEKWGGPKEIIFDKLTSWTESEIPGIKYYSGTASYTNTFSINEDEPAGNGIYLDLGEMYNIAEITVNGTNLGTCWKKPFVKDISGAIVRGENTIEIKVTNLWPNRLTGDRHLPKEERYTETNVSITGKWYGYGQDSEKEDALRPSGLLGPVRLHPVRTVSE